MNEEQQTPESLALKKKLEMEQQTPEVITETPPTPEKRVEQIDSSMTENNTRIEGMEASANSTSSRLAEIRQELAISTLDEKPPSILATEADIGGLRNQNAALRAEKAGLNFVDKSREMGQTEVLTAETEKPADSVEVNEDVDADNRKRERRENEDKKEISNSVKRLSGNLDEFQGTLSRNKFPRVSFNSDELRKAGLENSFDPKKLGEEIQTLRKSVDKIGVFKDARDARSMEPHNYRSVMDGMDGMQNDLRILKGKFDGSKSADYGELSDETKRTLSTLRRKTDSMQEALNLLKRMK